MLNFIIAAIALVLATIGGAAQADTLTAGSAQNQAATAGANNVNQPIINMPASSPITAGQVDQRINTNQAMSAAPAFGVQGIGCVKPGSGATVQVAGFGAAVAVAGDESVGCEAPRDIVTMSMMPGVFSDADKARRACAVPAIAKAAPARCKQLLDDGAAVSAVFNDAPVAQRKQPAPWQAGG